MNNKAICLVFLIIGLFLSPNLLSPNLTLAQEQQEGIRLSSRLILVPVSVSDRLGRPVPDLKAEDFIIEEEGKQQQVITLGEPGKTPIELALLFDVSGSTQGRFKFEQDAATRFVKAVLKPGDAVSVFSVGLIPRTVKERTKSTEEAVQGISSIVSTREPTAFFDSVVQSALYVGKTAEGGSRRVLVIISDGEENHSERHTFKDVLRELQKNDCLFYSINPTGAAIQLNKVSLKAQADMEVMAAQTGGKAFVPDNDEALEAVFRQIAEELQAQYLLGYYLADEPSEAGFKRLSVRVPKRPELRVRARQGYQLTKS